MANPLRAATWTVFYAKDCVRLADFYQAVLGLQRIEVGPTFIALGAGEDAPDVVIVQAPAALADTIEIATPAVARELTPIKVSFAVADAEALRTPIERLGGTLKATSTRWSWRGFWHLDGHDPEGNVFQLRQREAGEAPTAS